MPISKSLETLQKIDHDALIRVEVKLDNLAADVKVMGDGIAGRIADHETRLRKLEDIVVQTSPADNFIRLNKVIQEVHDFKTGANSYRIAAGVIGGLIAFILSQLSTWIELSNF